MAGCNQVFGIRNTELVDGDMRPDLDHDGIANAVDPCIAGMADGDEDYDGDSIPNRDDGCPAIDPNGPDADGDGIPDACDPFPDAARRSPSLHDAISQRRPQRGALAHAQWRIAVDVDQARRAEQRLDRGRDRRDRVDRTHPPRPRSTSTSRSRSTRVERTSSDSGYAPRMRRRRPTWDASCVAMSTTFHLELHGAGVTMSSPTSGIPSGDGTVQMTAVLAPRLERSEPPLLRRDLLDRPEHGRRSRS